MNTEYYIENRKLQVIILLWTITISRKGLLEDNLVHFSIALLIIKSKAIMRNSIDFFYAVTPCHKDRQYAIF